ncbi:hypothetical protein LJC17_00235 [Acholeplasma sp. OttesenSCG-928-E16]|nr:hypothetical protein [Acholeplasma sp. OttesenSCG-928-E16]
MVETILVKSKNNNISLAYKLMITISFGVAIFCLINASSSIFNAPFWIVPLLYSFLLVGSPVKKKAFAGPGSIVINIVMFSRYVILFFFMYIHDDTSQFEVAGMYNIHACLLICVEMIAIFIVLFVHKYKFGKSKRNNDVSASTSNFNKKIILIYVMIFIALFVSNTSLVGTLQIFEGSYDVEQYNEYSNINGAIVMLWQALLMAFYLFIILRLGAKYRKNLKKSMLVLSIGITLAYLFLVYISQYKISRWYPIVIGVSSIFFLLKIYPTRKTFMTTLIVIPMAILVLVATVMKNTSGTSSGFNALLDVFSVTNLDSYLAGPSNIANSILTNQKFDIDLNTLLYDLLNNFPVLNEYIDKTQVSNRMFNATIFGTFERSDQIMPLLGQSFSIFGYMLAPLLSICFVKTALVFDDKYRISTNGFSFLYAFIAIWCGIAVILNLTINIAWWYNRIIPGFLVFWLCQIGGKKIWQ